MAVERFRVRTYGGPADGEARIANSDGHLQYTWPLPLVFRHGDDGYYRRFRLDTGDPADGILRGASYYWIEFSPVCQCICEKCDEANTTGRIVLGHCKLAERRCRAG